MSYQPGSTRKTFPRHFAIVDENQGRWVYTGKEICSCCSTLDPPVMRDRSRFIYRTSLERHQNAKTSTRTTNNIREKREQRIRERKKTEKLGRTSYRKERIGTTDRLLGRYSFVVVVSADDEAFWDVIMMFIVRELWNGTHVSCCTTQWSCAIALFSSPRILNESCIQYSGVPGLIKIPVALKFR